MVASRSLSDFASEVGVVGEEAIGGKDVDGKIPNLSAEAASEGRLGCGGTNASSFQQKCHKKMFCVMGSFPAVAFATMDVFTRAVTEMSPRLASVTPPLNKKAFMFAFVAVVVVVEVTPSQ